MVAKTFAVLPLYARFFYNGFWWTKREEFLTETNSTANAICDNGLISYFKLDDVVFAED